ncbi:hypothetical protein [Enterococcus faecalis]|uniref:hypothetical protein n=1 Tax=Enterococcus TaxID=1350 RepID=UPI003A8F7787
MHSEKETIYYLMREIIKERRELSKQYFDLKISLDAINTTPEHREQQALENLKEEKKVPCYRNHDKKRIPYSNSSKKVSLYPLERISGYVVSILKDSPVPISNQTLYKKLVDDYEIHINYPNFTSNILPKLKDSKLIPIEKAYRGYWQYRKIEDN